MVQHKAMTALLERNDLVQVEGFIQKIKMIKVEAAKKKNDAEKVMGQYGEKTRWL